MFLDKDIKQLLRWAQIDGSNKRTRRRWDGKSKCAFVHVYTVDPTGQKHHLRIPEAPWAETAERIQATAKHTGNRKTKTVNLRGPKDLLELTEWQGILDGREINFTYLSDIQNRILTMVALGKKRRCIARALSGGRNKRSFPTSRVRFLIQDSYKKIRHNETKGEVMANVSIDIRPGVKYLLDNLAEETGFTRSYHLRQAINDYLSENVTGHFAVGWQSYCRIVNMLDRARAKGVEGFTGSAASGVMQIHYKDGRVFPPTV